MKKCKKILSILLSICMLLSISAGLNLTACAETIDDFKYIVEDGTAQITGYTGNATDLNIPATIGGYEVTHISNKAFFENTFLTNVTIPKSVTYIDSDAFDKCTSLTDFYVENDNVVYSSQDGVLFDKDKTHIVRCPIGNRRTSYSIPNSVTGIYRCAFKDCKGLTKVNIPDSVTGIGSCAFMDCEGLTKVNIPDSVTSIDYDAFHGCTSLTSITMPNSVKSTMGSVFYGCTSLAHVDLSDSLTVIDLGYFANCESLKSITIPKSVKEIYYYAFSNCTSLTSVNIPESVTIINRYAFEGCTSLKDFYYSSTIAKWNEINILPENENLKTVAIHCTDGTIIGENIVPAVTKKSIAKATVSGVKAKTYTGKALTQSVTVKLGNTTLKNGTDYTVSYKNNKNVGTATVTVTGKGNYEGTVSKSFKIKPKATTLSKVSAKKKGFTAKWKKQSKQTTGYQLQYATNSKFKKAKSVTVKSNKTVSVTQKSLKAKKKYYVRIRTYKTVNGKKYYSDWSKAKTVTTKK